MKNIVLFTLLLTSTSAMAQKTWKVGGQVGFQQFLRNNPSKYLDSVNISFSNAGEARVFGGAFVEYRVLSNLALQYELNFFKDFNTTYTSINRNNIDIRNGTTVSYVGINNSFSANYYFSKRLYLIGGFALQANTNQQKRKYHLEKAMLGYSEGIELVHSAIETNSIVFGANIGLGMELGRFSFRAKLQNNFTNFNKTPINPWGKSYFMRDRSYQIFLSTSITLFRK